jgi:transketolase
MSTLTFPQASTRETYGDTLVQLGKERQDIVALDADLAKSTQTIRFGKAFPNRFFYVGIQEQNMFSIAAGLASCGKTVFASTFAVFATTHAFDQLRLNIAQPKANVKVVCTHQGITVGEDGSSAFAVEDLALMLSLFTFTVIVPADAPETAQAVRAAAETPGPFYIRLSRPATPIVHGPSYTFTLGKAETLRDGRDATIIACGNLVAPALQAAEALAQQGISCRVLNMATLRPINKEAILKAARETGAIVTAEEHQAHGGLGSTVARVVAEAHPVPLELMAIPDRYFKSGGAWELMAQAGLTAEGVEAAVRQVVGRKKAH